MAIASQLLRLLSRIRQYLRRILKDGLLPQALTSILRRLAVWWSFRSMWNSGKEPAGWIKKPSSDSVGSRKGSEPLDLSTKNDLESEKREDEYRINPNGEIISLDDVACSLHPFDAVGIQSATRSSLDIPPSPQVPLLHIETPSIRPSSPISIIQHPGVSSRTEFDSASVGFRCLENKHFIPVMPEGTQRYHRRPRVRRKDTNITIQPLTNAFETPLPPPGWIKVIHTEGVGYFFNKEKRVYTDANLEDPNILRQAAIDIALLEDCISANHVVLPNETDLVIDLCYDDYGDIQTTYYYVHHQSRTIFFLDTFESNTLVSWYDVPGVNTERLLRQEIEAQYWFFLQLFPSSRQLSKDLVCELRDVILFFIGDFMTSPVSTGPYTLEDLHRILPLTDQLEQNIGHQSIGAICVLARFMYMFVHSRFLNFYGEPCARLERNFSVYGDPIHTRTWLIKTVSFFLLTAPDFHLRDLQKMMVDGIMHRSIWGLSMKKLDDEWQQLILLSTVMLNANVAFLAIQSVDTDHDPYRSPAQICSYLSVVASIGSIGLGLLLSRHNRMKGKDKIEEMQFFLTTRSQPRFGLEALAILHSLPYALLMWGIVWFLAAFAVLCFQNSSIHTRTLVGSFCFAVAALVAWCVWISWYEYPDDEKVDPAPEPEIDAHLDNSRQTAAPGWLGGISRPTDLESARINDAVESPPSPTSMPYASSSAPSRLGSVWMVNPNDSGHAPAISYPPNTNVLHHHAPAVPHGPSNVERRKTIH